MSNVIEMLVFDRTVADRDGALAIGKKINEGKATPQELSQWLSTAQKGSYNASDLNRIGQAMSYLAGLFRSYGYIIEVTGKADWDVRGIPTLAQLDTYISDLKALRGIVAMLPTTPTAPDTMERMDYITANAIEKILFDIDDTLDRMRRGWFYSGEIYAGEV